MLWLLVAAAVVVYLFFFSVPSRLYDHFLQHSNSIFIYLPTVYTVASYVRRLYNAKHLLLAAIVVTYFLSSPTVYGNAFML